MTYSEKLKDPRWQKKRLLVLEREGWKCQCCGNGDETLQVHHLIYSPGEPWDAPDNTLECLCVTCHEWRTDFDDFFHRGMAPTKLCLEFQGAFEVAFKHWDLGAKKGQFRDLETFCFYISEYLKQHRLKHPEQPQAFPVVSA